MAKDNKNNIKCIIEEKESVVARMLPPENCTLTKLSRETGIRKGSLSTWKSKAMHGVTKDRRKSENKITSKEKFHTVMETYTMSEAELSRYCREKGYYVQQIKDWRVKCLNANERVVDNIKNFSEELKEEKKKNKELSKEIRIKDKALAETTALLVLRKKLNALEEEQEED
ncbi:hypothetical protein ACER0A_010915 [Haloimpatiens sp. FM7315]|uniref:hypothetical protein n=1 Tax=Haloimpatiens sp. FM7315 TaxID=3298609 RepID=UPI00370BCDFC